MIVIFGKGKVGEGLDKLLTTLDMDHTLMDDADWHDETLNKAKFIIPSPGIKQSHKLYQEYGNKIISELSFLGGVFKKLKIRDKFTFVGVTGTNGKSTTVHILYNTFKQIFPDQDIYLSGNFGIPLSETINEIINYKGGMINEFKIQNSKSIIILECSSFMLYNLKDFIFDYSILTNIATDHLDWHKDMQEYVNTKLNLVNATIRTSFVHQGIEDKMLNNNIYNEAILARYANDYDLSSTQFLGKHNAGNLQASFLVIKQYIQDNHIDINENTIHQSLNQVQPLDHRMKLLREIDGIKIYDDGICTSSQALDAALSCFDHKIVLIAGGYDKGDTYDWLTDSFKEHIAFCSLIGQTSKTLQTICNGQKVPNQEVNSLQEVIDNALAYAKKNNIDTLLYSPGAASFDMFKNVYERVEKFGEIIKKLK